MVATIITSFDIRVGCDNADCVFMTFFSKIIGKILAKILLVALKSNFMLLDPTNSFGTSTESTFIMQAPIWDRSGASDKRTGKCTGFKIEIACRENLGLCSFSSLYHVLPRVGKW
jgi:hypothetical protein